MLTLMVREIFSAGVAVCLVFQSAMGQGGQVNEGDSPSGKIHFQVRGPEDGKHIYLSSAKEPGKEVDLCETPGWGNLVVHFSPDDFWIIVQDGGASLGVSLRLFRRSTGVVFKEMTDADIDGKAERLALKQSGVKAADVLDHRYVRVAQWSPDSRSVLITLSGHGSTPREGVQIGSWYAVYDLASGQLSFDLQHINKGAVDVAQRSKGSQE